MRREMREAEGTVDRERQRAESESASDEARASGCKRRTSGGRPVSSPGLLRRGRLGSRGARSSFGLRPSSSAVDAMLLLCSLCSALLSALLARSSLCGARRCHPSHRAVAVRSVWVHRMTGSEGSRRRVSEAIDRLDPALIRPSEAKTPNDRSSGAPSALPFHHPSTGRITLHPLSTNRPAPISQHSCSPPPFRRSLVPVAWRSDPLLFPSSDTARAIQLTPTRDRPALRSAEG